MTSQLPCFVGELSKKKQTLTTLLLRNIHHKWRSKKATSHNIKKVVKTLPYNLLISVLLSENEEYHNADKIYGEKYNFIHCWSSLLSYFSLYYLCLFLQPESSLKQGHTINSYYVVKQRKVYTLRYIICNYMCSSVMMTEVLPSFVLSRLCRDMRSSYPTIKAQDLHSGNPDNVV